jgi:hypothetical protein
MFKVQANSLAEYFDADPARKADLQAFDALITAAVPRLTRWFYPGAPDGGAGMRMNLIGYGSFTYEVKSGQRVEWPIVGLALQKNYLSLYTSVIKDGAAITDAYKGKLGELRSGRGNVSFVTFGQLNADALSALLTDIDQTLDRDGLAALVYSTYPIIASSVTP